MGDGAGADIPVEDAGIKHEDLDEGGQTELAGLQQHVEIMHLFEKRHLRPVHLEPDAPARFVGDPVEIVQPPAPVGKLINRRLEVRGFCH